MARPLHRLRRLARRALTLLHSPPTRLCYSSGYRFEVPGGLHDPDRAARVMSFLEHEGLLLSGRLHKPTPASFEELRLVHDDAYLERLQRPGGLDPLFGYRLPDPTEQAMLGVQREMTGGTIQALRKALAQRSAAANLGGGLHHAHRDRGQGFCAFNDLAVAIRVARREGFAGRVLVIDLDLHDGDGTRALFASDPSVHTYSVHNQPWDEAAAIESTSIALGSAVDDARYLRTLRDTLPDLLQRFAPDLVIYLAGTDPASDDLLGDWNISDDGMVERDQWVAGLALARNLPLVVTLGGGYGESSWRHSARFLAWLVSGRRFEPPTTEELVVDRLRDLVHDVSAADLRGDVEDEPLFDASDLFGSLGQTAAETRFLGYYSVSGIELGLERLGLLQRLRELGFAAPRVELELAPEPSHTLRIFGTPPRGDLLFELRAHRDRRTIPGAELLAIDWLLLQNPRAHFAPGRPALPGQTHPGLGLLRETMGTLVLMCERLHLDGIVFTPSHYHLAIQARGRMCFLDPAAEGVFDAIGAALAGQPLARATRLADAAALRDRASGERIGWKPAAMVAPVSVALETWFASDAYRAAVEAARPELDLDPVIAAEAS